MERTRELAVVPVEGKIVSDQLLNFEGASEHNTEAEHPNFLESSTNAISLSDLATKCIVPTFSDSTLTISHQSAIASVYKAAEAIFGELTTPEIRVSHAINGRVASALHKPAKDLTDEEKTLFYQRMAFIAHVKSLTRIVAGSEVHLCIGMCRCYNEDKLYSRKSPEKMKIFCGWTVSVCSNLCLTCDGNSGTVECLTEADIYQKAFSLFSGFNPEKEDTLRLLENLNNTKTLPVIEIGDQAANAAVRGFVSNPNFGLKEGESSISTWSALQLFNEAIKQTVIDRWLDRNQNCTDFVLGIQKALQGEDTEGYSWFLE